MAKRYHGSQGMYAGYESRHRMEMQDGGMIHEDKHAIANLPQEVMIKPYPREDYAHYNLDDTIRVIDRQMKDDGKHQKRGEFPEKY